MFGNKQLYNMAKQVGLSRMAFYHRAKRTGLEIPVSVEDFKRIAMGVGSSGRLSNIQRKNILELINKLGPQEVKASPTPKPKAKCRFEIIDLKFEQFKSGGYEATGCGQCIYKIIPGKGYFIVLREPNMVALANDVKTIEEAMQIAQNDYEAMLKKYLVQI